MLLESILRLAEGLILRPSVTLPGKMSIFSAVEASQHNYAAVFSAMVVVMAVTVVLLFVAADECVTPFLAAFLLLQLK